MVHEWAFVRIGNDVAANIIAAVLLFQPVDCLLHQSPIFRRVQLELGDAEPAVRHEIGHDAILISVPF